MKKKIKLVILHGHVARDVLATDLLDRLRQSFAVHIEVAMNIDPTPFKSLGFETVLLPTPDSRRNLVFDKARRLKSIRAWEPVSGMITEDFHTTFRKKKADKIQRLLFRLKRMGLADLILRACDWYLDFSRPNHLIRPDDRSDLVLIPTVFRDIVAEDFVRVARRRGVKTMFVQMNMDAFSLKRTIVNADFLALWGETGFYPNNLLYGYQAEQLRVIGSIKLDVYRSVKLSRAEARKKLGLKSNGPVLLFCGGRTFTNGELLDALDQAISSGALRNDLQILYKPHPKAALAQGDGVVKNQSGRFKNVTFLSTTQDGEYINLDFYPMLFAASDAMVTAFSTMALEGAMHGLPVALVQDLPTDDSLWPVRLYPHTRIYYDNKFSIQALKPAHFLSAVRRVIDLIGDETACSQAKAYALSAVYHDDQPVSDRLAVFIEDALVRDGLRQTDLVVSGERSTYQDLRSLRPIEKSQTMQETDKKAHVAHDRPVYENRWKLSRGTGDASILCFSNPRTQVEFFYLYYNRIISDAIRSLGRATNELKLLEVGCGRGTAALYQSVELNVESFVTDFSLDALKIAQDNFAIYDQDCRAVRGDAYNLPVANDSMDVVISLGVLEHFPEPKEPMAEMYRVLKPGGLMVSMNVPERPDNIQRTVVGLNRFLITLKSFISKDVSKPWLDKTRSKTGDDVSARSRVRIILSTQRG